jgi:PAS domain S-box-containing protein
MDIARKIHRYFVSDRSWRGIPILASILVFGMICYLLGHTFVSQKRLQDAALTRLEDNLAERARDVGLFIMERKNDLLELAASDVVEAYFTNKALGMSKEYGLTGSLNLIYKQFQHRSRTNMSGMPGTYARMMLFAADGETLVDYQGAMPCSIKKWDWQAIDKTGSVPMVQLDRSNPTCLLFTAAVLQQGKVVGYIAGWIPTLAIHRQILSTGQGSTDKAQEGNSDNLILNIENSEWCSDRVLAKTLEDNLQRGLTTAVWHDDKDQPLTGFGQQTTRFFLKNGEGDKKEYLAIASQLDDMAIRVVHLIEQKYVINPISPYRLVGIMALVFLVVIGITWLAIRQKTRAQVLAARLDEVNRQQEEIKVANHRLTREIEQRRKAEEQAAEGRERLELVVYATDIGVWEWFVPTGETVFNERWADIVGYSLTELEPVNIHTWLDLCHPDDLQYSEILLQKHFSGETDLYDCECRMRHKNGHWVWVHDRGRVVEWLEAGKPLRMAGTHADISRRKEAELAIFEANKTLEQRVEDRTKELVQLHGQMVMHEKMASVGQLAAGIAHELNNPINFVRTNFATLADNFTDLSAMLKAYQESMEKCGQGVGQAAIAEKLAVLAKEVNIDFLLTDIPVLLAESEAGFERIAKIIQAMRDFSRSEMAEDFCWANINTGLEATLVIARNEYRYNAEIVKNFGELPEIYCMLQQLNQVFLNLIVNSSQAIAAMPPGYQGLITLSTWTEGNHVICEIGDNGPGVPESIRHRIFEPFFTTKAPGKGTGLGLSISYDIIVNKHYGELKVACPATGGTVFTISLPIKNSNIAQC